MTLLQTPWVYGLRSRPTSWRSTLGDWEKRFRKRFLDSEPSVNGSIPDSRFSLPGIITLLVLLFQPLSCHGSVGSGFDGITGHCEVSIFRPGFAVAFP